MFKNPNQSGCLNIQFGCLNIQLGFLEIHTPKWKGVLKNHNWFFRNPYFFLNILCNIYFRGISLFFHIITVGPVVTWNVGSLANCNIFFDLQKIILTFHNEASLLHFWEGMMWWCAVICMMALFFTIKLLTYSLEKIWQQGCILSFLDKFTLY